MRARQVSWAGPAVALSLILAGCSRKDQADNKPVVRADESWPNVVLISVDTLRRDHLGCYGYDRNTSPHIDQLAEEGALFENMISSTSWTLPAHAATFTGLADSVHGALDTDTKLADDRVTLAERLKGVGYATVGFFSGPTLYPAFGLGQGFDTYVDCTSYPELSAASAKTPGIEIGGPLQMASMADVTSPRIYAAVRSWLMHNPARPFFMFIHMWDVHFDFIPPPPYDQRFDPDYDGTVTGKNFIFDDSINAQMPRRDLEHIIALYDGEIAWTDEHIGKILAELDALGLRDSMIVMLLADHGTEFFEHNAKGHRQTLFDEVIRIPLLIRYPGHIPAGRRITEQVRMIDVLPTLLELVGMSAPADVMGQSLAPLLSGGKLQHDTLAISELFTLGRTFRSFRRLDRKIIRHELSKATVIYNLRADPGEQRPLQDANNLLVQAALRDARLGDKWLADFRSTWPVSTSSPELPEKVRRRLESFGYLEREGADEEEHAP
ncbi:MAG: sulfatase [Phycisphaerae bacterium]